MKRFTSDAGRRFIPLLAAFTLGALVASAAFELRAWNYWQEQKAAQVAEFERETVAQVERGQAEAQRVARGLAARQVPTAEQERDAQRKTKALALSMMPSRDGQKPER